MRQLTIQLFLFLSVGFIFGQGKKTDLIKYSGDFEKNALQNSKNNNALELLLAVSPEADKKQLTIVQTRINEFVQAIKAKNIVGDKKLIKYIHDRTHKEFLKTYKEISQFNRIFQDGQYNCVSSTSLFALIFDELSIPYIIKELPTHVYLVAYPLTSGIVVEATAPKNGYYMASNFQIQKGVDYLLNKELTTVQEIESKGAQLVYNNYFYNNNTVNLKQTAGLQYYNETLVCLRNEDNVAAFHAICKATALYPSKQLEFLKQYILDNLLSVSNFESITDIHYLKEYTSLKEADMDNIEISCDRLIEKQLLLKSRKEFIDSSLSYLINNVEDSVKRNFICENIFVGIAQYYSKSSADGKALEYAQKAYKLNPGNVYAKSYISYSIIKLYSRKNLSENLFNKLNELEKELPFLNTDNNFLMFKFYVNATLSSDFFNEEEQEKGEKYFQKAVEAYDRMVDKTVIDDYDYGLLYAEAGAYYYRDNQYEKALKVLYKGLELVPDHERLTARLKIVLDKKVMAYEEDEDDFEDEDDDLEYIQYFEAEEE